jgi:hypothetical protein
MKLTINKNSCFLLVIGSWLVARLWWTFEMSRLAFYRSVPKKKIHQIVYASNQPPVSQWVYQDDRFSILNFENQSGSFVIYKLAELNKN